jgi:hypothetical protein
MRFDSKRRLIVLIALSILSILVFYALPGFHKITTAARICQRSNSCSTFDEWAQVIRQQAYITSLDHTPQDITIPDEPHFILANHSSSHCRLGSFMTIAAAVQTPANIVCYSSYPHLLCMSPIVHRILKNEITIDGRLSKTEKERRMVMGIRRAFRRGKNVIMFVDAHRPHVTIRTLNKVVLGYFPTYKKQLIHVQEPSHGNQLEYRRYPATFDLDVIERARREIIGIVR